MPTPKPHVHRATGAKPGPRPHHVTREYKTAQTALALGNVYMNTCQHPLAIEWFRRAIVLNPQCEDAHTNLIFLLDAQLDTTEADASAARRAWWTHLGEPAYRQRPTRYLNDPDPERPLRVGYVSGDYLFHSAAIAWIGVARFHSEAVQPVYLSTLAPTRYDKVTTTTWQTQQYGGLFVDVSAWTPTQLANAIYQAPIDILVDLSGYTLNNRLLTFAQKPAPIQIQAWGYVLGTASPAMDYLFADDIVCTPAIRASLHEQVIDLPALLTYLPRHDLPATVTELPCTQDQPVTFAVFQRAMKTNAECIGVWREILARVPSAQIVFKANDYSPEKRTEIAAQLRGLENRVTFDFAQDHFAHMQSYQRVDLALDPWPQTGGVSTLEALWMGVPTVTFLGERMIQRASASFLTRCGYAADCVATTREEYIDKAVALVTTHRERLAQIRREARETMRASPIMMGYVEAVEQRYREPWRAWCASQKKEAA